MSDDTFVLNPPPREAADGFPWGDDLLDAQGVAEHLGRYAKALINGGEGAVIALNGGYGTGKTFMLRRWVNEMKDKGQVALYYNAWENDADADPLVSIVELVSSVDGASSGLENAMDALNLALTSFLHHRTGVDVQAVRDAAKGKASAPLEAERKRRQSRSELRKCLEQLVERGSQDNPATGGVVVVIDELDRCRPEFAMALLERAKHVLNVPGIVFVFGVDMTSLREFVKVVHGDIDTAGYLLRMFDIVLQMPAGVVFNDESASSSESWVKYLWQLAMRHRLSIGDAPKLRSALDDAIHTLALVAENGGFTPREMEHVVRTLACAAWLASELAGEGRHYRIVPDVVTPMAIAKIKDHDAYRQMILRPNGAPAVIDCVSGLMDESVLDPLQRGRIDAMEMMLYRACHPKHSRGGASDPLAYLALRKLAEGQELTDDEKKVLSTRAARMDNGQASSLLQKQVRSITDNEAGEAYAIGFGTVRHLASLIDSKLASS